MTVIPLRPRPQARVYTDILGRRWDVEKLDDVLADPSARQTILAAASHALRSDKTWSPGVVLAGSRDRYRREAVAALMLVLVVRYFDTEGAHFLGRRACR